MLPWGQCSDISVCIFQGGERGGSTGGAGHPDAAARDPHSGALHQHTAARRAQRVDRATPTAAWSVPSFHGDAYSRVGDWEGLDYR